MENGRVSPDRLLQSLATGAAGDQLRTFRFYMAFRWVSAFAVLIHASVGTLFLLQGVMEMAFFNIFSVALYVVAFLANEKGRHNLAFGLGLAEILVHQALVVHFVGWESGY